MFRHGSDQVKTAEEAQLSREIAGAGAGTGSGHDLRVLGFRVLRFILVLVTTFS